MSFLTINGVVVPVAAGSVKRDVVEIGTRQRAYSGALRTDVRSTKSTVRCRTIPLSREDVEGLALLLAPGGALPSDALRFDGTTDSDETVAADVVAAVVSPSTAADGVNIVNETYGGAGALGCTAGTTNLLSANASSIETSTAGWSVVSGGEQTLTQVATHYVFGTHGLRVVTSGSVNTFPSQILVEYTGTSGLVYTASAYLRGSGSVVLALRHGSVYASSARVTLNDQWQRVSVSAVVSAADLEVRIAEDPADQGATYYIDGVMLEQKPAAGPWVVGGSSLSATEISWNTDAISDTTSGFTVAMRFRHNPRVSPTADECLLSSSIVRASLAASGALTVGIGAGTLTASASIATYLDGLWHQLVIVRRKSYDGSSPNLSVWVDGVRLAYAIGSYSDVGTGDIDIYMGSNAGDDGFVGWIDEVTFYRVPLPPLVVADMAAYVAAAVPVIAGSVTSGVASALAVRVESVDNIRCVINGVQEKHAGVLSLILEEA